MDDTKHTELFWCSECQVMYRGETSKEARCAHEIKNAGWMEEA